MKRRFVVGGMVLVALVVAVVSCDSTRLRLRAPPDARGIVALRDVVYVPGSTNPKHRLDVYAPKDANLAPVVLFVHGGYWVGGDKDFYHAISGLYGTVGETLAERGIVTVVQSYRLVPETTIDGCLDDVMAALRWTLAHAREHGGDPARIFLMGHSAGGHLVAFLGSDDSQFTRREMSPDSVRGYLALSAVWDIADMHATQDASFQERVTYPVFGKDPARWTAYSPLAKLLPERGRSTRPFFIAVGDRDYPYLIPQGEHARDALGSAARFYVANGNDHDAMVLRFGARDDNMSAAVADFVTSTPARSAAP